MARLRPKLKRKSAKIKRKPGTKLKAPPLSGRPPSDDRWEIFCLEYSKDFNATRAYIKAGYSENGAAASACQLLTNPNIKARIREIVSERKARIKLEGDEILLEIQKLAMSDIRRLINPLTGAVLPVNDWPDDLAPAVAGFEVHEKINPFTGEITGYVKKFKLWDKPKSQELLGKNKKLFGNEDGTNVTVTIVTADEAQVREIHKKIHEDC